MNKAKAAKLIATLRANPADVKFGTLDQICQYYFGPPRNKGTSHHVYKTPWQGDPRVNIQKSGGGKAKAYQVRQVLKAIERMNTDDQP